MSRLPAKLEDRASWVPVWSDRFAQPDRLRLRWQLRGTEYAPGRSRSRADWAAAAAYDGALHLRALPDPVMGEGYWLAGHIGSLFTFTHGWAAAKIRFHPHQGHHSAFWLQSMTPYATPDHSEVDVAEWFGAKDPFRERGVDMHHCLYWREEDQRFGDFTEPEHAMQLAAGGNRLEQVQGNPATNNLDYSTVPWPTRSFIYSVRWEPDRYEFWIDDRKVAVIREGLSSTPKQLVLSMIGRDFEVPLMDTSKLGTYDDVVDWVRVWQRKA